MDCKLQVGRLMVTFDFSLRSDRAIYLNAIKSLLQEYNHPLKLWMKGLGLNEEDFQKYLGGVNAESKRLGLEFAFNRTTIDKTLECKLGARVSEIIAPKIFNDLQFIKHSEQADQNLADFKYKKTINIDVKSKGSNSNQYPANHWDVTIPYSQRNQKADYYIHFHTFKTDFTRIIVMGMISKKDFFEKSYSSERGETHQNNVTYVNKTAINKYTALYDFEEDYETNLLSRVYR